MRTPEPPQDGTTVIIGFDRSRWRLTNRRAIALITVVAIVATVAVFVASDADATDDRLLVVDETGTISLLDPDTGDALFEVPGATATPDRSALLTTETTGGGTVLESRDPRTGTVTGSTVLTASDLTVRTISPQGQAVALMPGKRGAGIYDAGSRTSTSLTVSYLDDRSPRTYELEGNIEPEMFSFDETGLYVLEFVPPTTPDSYYVRRLDLDTGEMTDTGAPQVGLNPKMRGRARASVLHPEGRQLFTLYTLPQTGEPVFDPEAPDTPLHAFIHVINLEEDWSYCIFLPDPIGTVDEAGVGMGIAPDGGEVVVVDPATSTLARVDTADLEVIDTVRVDQLRAVPAATAVGMAGDGTMYVGTGSLLLELSGPDLEATRVWSQDTTITGVSLAAAGDQLRVGGGGVVTLIDRTTGEEAGVLRAPGRGTVTLLGPPGGSVTEFPLECAC